MQPSPSPWLRPGRTATSRGTAGGTDAEPRPQARRNSLLASRGREEPPEGCNPWPLCRQNMCTPAHTRALTCTHAHPWAHTPTHTHTRTPAHTRVVTCMRAHTPAHVHSYLSPCAHTCSPVHSHTCSQCTHTHTCSRMRSYMCSRAHPRACSRVHTHPCSLVCTPTHTRTQRLCVSFGLVPCSFTLRSVDARQAPGLDLPGGEP